MFIYDYFIVDRNGKVVKLKEYEEKVVKRYSPTFKPLDMEKDIEKLL